MCGIAGYVGKGDRDALDRMTGSLAHRGPDDSGAYAAGGVGLGFRRLAIIDLAGGKQPMSNADGSVRVVFNGEIYNFKELRAELEGKYRFATSSDTEVIVHLYEEIGERAFERLWGMFAIAIWEERRKRLVVARDRLGKKPVYCYRHAEGFVFASELKAIAKHPSFRKTLDLGALASYFSNDWLPARRSIFLGVEKLPPAHYGIWQDGRWSLHRYWSLDEDARREFPRTPDLSEDEALDALEDLLSDAVRRRLVADVPVGVFLSGGVDSSLVTALAVRASGERVRTFSIGFNEASFDESVYAREVARRLGTDHHEHVLSADDALGCLEEVGRFLDEPFADPSILPTYLLSKNTKEQVTVALSGDGGDEAFWGYASFKAHRVAEWAERLPSVIRERWLPFIVRHLPPSDRYMSLPFVAERFLRGLGKPILERDRLWRATVSPHSLPHLFRPEAWQEAKRQALSVESWEKDFAAEPWKQLAASYLFDYLPDDILYKADRASMAASLEVRAPLLDHRVVEFAWRLPDRMKLRGLNGKYLLKKLLKRHLPARLVDRKKQGFALPTAAWLRGPLRERCETYFSKSFQDRIGLFRQETIDRWWREHLERRRDHRKCLWALLMFCQWRERWMA